MDCFNCSKPDCDNDDLTTEDERISQDVRDRFALYARKYGTAKTAADYARSDRRKTCNNNYNRSEKGKERAKKHRKTKKGKETQRRYNSSEKGKASRKRYAQSEKGKECVRRQTQKAIASGKNAERCRAYYQRKKEKKLRELFEKEKQNAG